MASSDADRLVTFRGGFLARWSVVRRLLDLEARGARFERTDRGAFRVYPRETMTPDDRAFFAAHRDEAREVLEYTVNQPADGAGLH